MLYSFIFTLCVCRSAVVEWLVALAGPGSQLAVAKNYFFFFLSYVFTLAYRVRRALGSYSR